MDESVRIRPYQPGDMPRLLRLEASAFGTDAWDRSLFEWYVSAYPALFLIAEVGGRLAGYCIARTGKAGIADIDSIAVFRRWRRHGIGTALLRAAITRLRRRGMNAIGLMVRRENAPAVAFYRRHGFRRVRTVAGYYEDNATGWRMMLNLNAGTNGPVIA